MVETSKGLIFEKMEKAGWITISRPERMNALASESLREFYLYLGKMEADPEVKVAVITGEGDKAFCAGMDMVGMEKSAPLVARRRSREIQMLTNRIDSYSLPTIAAVNGIAMGVGLEICMSCDFVMASAHARFGFPEVRLGMIPCGGGTQRLPRLIGPRRAGEMILAGKIIDAEQALDWALINAVAEGEGLRKAVEELVEKLVQGGRIALFQAKRCLGHSMDMDLNRGLEYETECFTTCFSTGELAWGLKHFAGKVGGESGTDSDVEGKEAGREGEDDIFE
ncbi:MAG: enoyl-CoA hydratase/isomerase family protein [Actinomycetota bacterium]|nr:enoyl-CoA hydratase/isomerase family protein [Actinomycetota bacterium]